MPTHGNSNDKGKKLKNYFNIFLDFVNYNYNYNYNYYCGAQIICGPGPFTREGARGPSRGKAMAQARQDSLEIQPGTVLSSADPKSHQKEG